MLTERPGLPLEKTLTQPQTLASVAPRRPARSLRLMAAAAGDRNLLMAAAAGDRNLRMAAAALSLDAGVVRVHEAAGLVLPRGVGPVGGDMVRVRVTARGRAGARVRAGARGRTRRRPTRWPSRWSTRRRGRLVRDGLEVGSEVGVGSGLRLGLRSGFPYISAPGTVVSMPLP